MIEINTIHKLMGMTQPSELIEFLKHGAVTSVETGAGLFRLREVAGNESKYDSYVAQIGYAVPHPVPKEHIDVVPGVYEPIPPIAKPKAKAKAKAEPVEDLTEDDLIGD